MTNSFDKSLVLRMPLDLHELLKELAEETKESVNTTILALMIRGISGCLDTDRAKRRLRAARTALWGEPVLLREKEATE